MRILIHQLGLSCRGFFPLAYRRASFSKRLVDARVRRDFSLNL